MQCNECADGFLLNGSANTSPPRPEVPGDGDEARANLAGALRDMAETNLLRGEALPIPDASRSDPQAELQEPIYPVLQTGQQLPLQGDVAPDQARKTLQDPRHSTH